MIDIQDYRSEIIDTSTLTPHPHNPRTVKKDDIERLKRQIIKLGQYKPIIVDTRTGYIVGGHMRLEALKQLNVLKVLVSYITSSDDNEALEYMLSDNDRAGQYNDQALAELLQDVKINMEDYKVDLGEPRSLQDILNHFGGEDIDFSSIESTEDREKQFKEHSVTCPNCQKIFTIEV